MDKLKLEYVGRYWGAWGDLFYLDHPDGRQARVFVDSVGQTCVDIRRIPEGGYFHSERVETFRALNGAARAEKDLNARGFIGKRLAGGNAREPYPTTERGTTNARRV